jgi:hypothetical protein
MDNIFSRQSDVLLFLPGSEHRPADSWFRAEWYRCDIAITWINGKFPAVLPVRDVVIWVITCRVPTSTVRIYSTSNWCLVLTASFISEKEQCPLDSPGVPMAWETPSYTTYTFHILSGSWIIVREVPPIVRLIEDKENPGNRADTDSYTKKMQKKHF